MSAVYAGISAFLSLRVIDGLMSRWLARYSKAGCMIRLLSFNILNNYLSSVAISLTMKNDMLLLPVWIGISCILTIAYTIENWVISNLRSDHRQLNLYEVVVFGVAPVGMASFVTMCLGLMELFLLRTKE